MAQYSVHEDGFSMEENFLPEQEVQDLVIFADRSLSTNGRQGGVRNLLSYPKMRNLAQSSVLQRLVQTILGSGARVVRGILFDKTEGANWKVPWHQDLTIAVNQKIETAGFGPWSIKAGVLHVQPPASVLEKMVSVRLHLDDCPKENGALRVIVGSHLNGKLEKRAVADLAGGGVAVTCEMRRRGVLIMRPLLLHASSASGHPGHRRVVHFDYAAAELPPGMGWAEVQP
ncbi:MAG TPA: phytanoyl-CoA dioxygenase family protein [Edaphobacter sp.]|nr:phytanoyl-CoA dioxygenase family protein [Edaphobacter sp.]